MVRERLAERSADVTKSVPVLARVVLTGVADTPFRATAAEAVLTGAAPGPSVFEAAAHTAQGDLDPPSDLHGTAAYRRHVAGVLMGAFVLCCRWGSVAMAVEKTTKARQTCSPSAQSSRTH